MLAQRVLVARDRLGAVPTVCSGMEGLVPPGVPLSEVSPSSGLEDTVGVAFSFLNCVGCAGIPWLNISAWVPPATCVSKGSCGRKAAGLPLEFHHCLSQWALSFGLCQIEVELRER